MTPKDTQGARIFWIGYDGVNGSGKDDDFWVMTKKPSDISGGGSNGSIKVIEYRAFQALSHKLERYEKALEFYADTNNWIKEFVDNQDFDFYSAMPDSDLETVTDNRSKYAGKTAREALKAGGGI